MLSISVIFTVSYNVFLSVFEHFKHFNDRSLYLIPGARQHSMVPGASLVRVQDVIESPLR